MLRLDVLIEDQRQDELLNEVDELERLFSQYMDSHSKCQMLIAPSYDEFDDYSTESIDRKVSGIKKRIIEVLDDVPAPVTEHNTATLPVNAAMPNSTERVSDIPVERANSTAEVSVKSRSTKSNSIKSSKSSAKSSGKSSKSSKSVSSQKAREKA